MDGLFNKSLTGVNALEGRLSRKFEYSGLYTFAQNKVTPVYNWFYYKEGYSRDFVWRALEELRVPAGSLVLDQFCGAGTTLLAAKQAGYASAGFDVLPLGVFVSRVKMRDYADLDKLESEAGRLMKLRYRKPGARLVDIGFMDMRKVYTPYARDDIAFFRENIMAVEDEAVRDFLMLALMSVVGQASNVMKDGGVLRMVSKRHVPPVRHMLRSKLNRMLRDLKAAEAKPDARWSVEAGDARALPLGDGSVDAVVTSPPYLNFVDYTKVYALELSLLVSSTRELEALRRRSVRSHVGARYDGDGEMPAAVRDALGMVTRMCDDDKTPAVVGGYLNDLYLALLETMRVLREGGCAVFVVGNATLPGVTVDVDLMLAGMGLQLGFTVEDIWVGNVRWADVHGIRKQRPARESAVVLRR